MAAPFDNNFAVQQIATNQNCVMYAKKNNYINNINLEARWLGWKGDHKYCN